LAWFLSPLALPERAAHLHAETVREEETGPADRHPELAVELEEALARLQAHLTVLRARRLLARRRGLSPEGAMHVLTEYSRHSDLPVVEVARRYLEDEISL
jgi:AmiR/NasT family two-component response regulator